MAANLCLQPSLYTNQSQFRPLAQADFYSKANAQLKHESKTLTTQEKLLRKSKFVIRSLM